MEPRVDWSERPQAAARLALHPVQAGHLRRRLADETAWNLGVGPERERGAACRTRDCRRHRGVADRRERRVARLDLNMRRTARLGGGRNDDRNGIGAEMASHRAA